jgi:hypothetical protein
MYIGQTYLWSMDTGECMLGRPVCEAYFWQKCLYSYIRIFQYYCMHISDIPMRATCISRQLKWSWAVSVSCFTEYESGVRDERHVTGCHTDNKKTAVWVELWNVSERNIIFLWQGTAALYESALVPSRFDNKTNGIAYNVQCTMEAMHVHFQKSLRCEGKEFEHVTGRIMSHGITSCFLWTVYCLDCGQRIMNVRNI